MAFFSLFAIVDKDDRYKKLTNDICRRRKKLLFDGLGIEIKEDPYDAAYYTQFDLLEWANRNYNDEFAEYLQQNYKPVDILIQLAEQSSIVLLDGGGFNAPEWSIRISLANLRDELYSKIGENLLNVLETYATRWRESKLKAEK